MTQEEKAKEIISVSNTNQVYDVVDFNALHEALHEDLIEMAAWKEQRMIEKACEWLAPAFKDLAGYYSGSELLDDFKKAMEE